MLFSFAEKHFSLGKVYSAIQCKNPELRLRQVRNPETTGQGKRKRIILLSLLTVLHVNFQLGNTEHKCLLSEEINKSNKYLIYYY